jgi:hypothetical protein
VIRCKGDPTHFDELVKATRQVSRQKVMAKAAEKVTANNVQMISGTGDQEIIVRREFVHTMCTPKKKASRRKPAKPLLHVAPEPPKWKIFRLKLPPSVLATEPYTEACAEHSSACLRARNMHAILKRKKGLASCLANPLFLLVPKRGLEPRQAYAH